MSKAKSERLMNLLILLLNARGFITRDRIRETIEGYRGQSDAAFSRMFERDKVELRAAGIPIITGSNDADSDEQDGYRVVRSDFELPPVEFTNDELAVLGVANSVWQDSVAAQLTSDALSTLRAAGIEPDPIALSTLRPRISTEPGLDEILAAVHDRRRITFGYRGTVRTVEPWMLQQRRGRWYLLAHDVDREATRRFKLTRFTGPVKPVGRVGAFASPDGATLQAAARSEFEDETATALIAVRSGRGRDLVRGAEPAVWDGPVPEGFDVYEVSRNHTGGLVGEVCSLGADAILLAPEQLRQRVLVQLRAVADRVEA